MSEPLSGRVVEPSGQPASGGPRPGPGSGGLGGLLSSKWAKAWIVPVIFGAASVVLGVLVLAWPGHTVGALTVIFGLYLLITGIYRFAAAIQLHGVDPVARVVALVLAALSAAVGVVCLINPFTTASTFAFVAGAFWFAAGADHLARRAAASDAWPRSRRGTARPASPGECSAWSLVC